MNTIPTPNSADTNPLNPILKFLHTRNPDIGEIKADVDLVDSRIIDSLDFVELVFIIESSTGKEIDLQEISVDSLRTLGSIQKTFFS